LEVKLKKIELILLNLKDSPDLLDKYLSKNIKGILYFGDFSNNELAKIHIQKLKKIIQEQPKECTVCFVIFVSTSPIDISKTELPLILQEAKGRTISLIDLARKI